MKALTFDDIQLVPKYSKIKSRKDVSLTTHVSRQYQIRTPIVVAPMDTVCEETMAVMIMDHGGVGCIHRFCSIEEQCRMVSSVNKHRKEKYKTTDYFPPIMAAIGVNGDYFERAIELVKSGCNILIIDVAHGHHENVKNALERLKIELPKSVDIIAGNIATVDSAVDLESWGADGLRVGIGGGSLCTTRIKTGFGIPNITAICEISTVSSVPIMIDGGIRSSGDIAKSLALGADCAMIGSILSGTDQTPQAIIYKDGKRYKTYRGLASLETKQAHNQKQRNVEGVATLVPYKGDANIIVEDIIDGLRSSLSYGGSFNLEQFRLVDYVRVTNAGAKEAKPHLIS
jgi:IMP dehydrogenase